MNNLIRSRKNDYDHALSLASEGEDEAALDILWDLRLKVDLSIYRRALVNLTLAAILRRADRIKYAQECLDLLDLLRQQHANVAIDEVEIKHMKDMENTAKDIIDEAANINAHPSNTPQRIRQDPDTGLLSEDDFETAPSPAATVTDGMQGLTLVPELAENPPAKDEGVVWVSQLSAPLENIPTNLPYIEGFLRDEYYTPFTKYSPSAPKKDTQKAAGAPRQLTPATSSPPRDRNEH